MLALAMSFGVYGIEAFPVEVEVDQSRGFTSVAVVGLPDTAVKESLDRVRAAVRNTGYHFQYRKLTINLAPADMRKEGAAFDLPIAIGFLAATEQLLPGKLESYAVTGELALDGRLRPVKGVLAMAMRCRDDGIKGFIVPDENAEEAAVVDGIEVIPLSHLSEVVGFLADQVIASPMRIDLDRIFQQASNYDLDFADVRGQEHAKRALTIAAAGGHNVLMIGPPGAGKTMLAQRLPTIMPPLTLPESLETTRVYSVSGLLGKRQALIATRPFRSPHHTISEPGLVGGGTHPRPGEVSLAHHGVLFLDELPEFHRKTLEVLRQPLEDGEVSISRALMSITYPSKLMLVAAMNPCPCGYATDPRKECRCTPRQIQNYLSRISGPLLDRIDIHLDVPAVPYRELKGEAGGESSAQMRAQVLNSRAVQTERFRRSKVYANARMSTRQVKRYCILTPDAEGMLAQAMQELALSARAYTKILKVARTIADLDPSTNSGQSPSTGSGQAEIRVEHVSEAIQYRSLDRGLWA